MAHPEHAVPGFSTRAIASVATLKDELASLKIDHSTARAGGNGGACLGSGAIAILVAVAAGGWFWTQGARPRR